MKVVIDAKGATVDAHDLGPLLGIPAHDVIAKMQSGEITSQSEKGIGTDLGNHRLTFWFAGKRTRITCDSEGHVLKTTQVDASRVR